MALDKKKWKHIGTAMEMLTVSSGHVIKRVGPYACAIGLCYILASLMNCLYRGGEGTEDEVDSAARRALRAIGEELRIQPGIFEKYWEQQ